MGILNNFKELECKSQMYRRYFMKQISKPPFICGENKKDVRHYDKDFT